MAATRGESRINHVGIAPRPWGRHCEVHLGSVDVAPCRGPPWLRPRLRPSGWSGLWSRSRDGRLDRPAGMGQRRRRWAFDFSDPPSPELRASGATRGEWRDGLVVGGDCRSALMTLRSLWAAVIVGALSLSCSTVSHVGSTATPHPSPSLALDDPGGNSTCRPPSPAGASPLEIHGTGTNLTVWIKLFPQYPPTIKVGDQAKIVWRITGTGSLVMFARDPNGLVVQPDRPPFAQTGGSSWAAPGDQWGSSFTFTVGGCWDLHVVRGNAYGDVWLLVPYQPSGATQSAS